MLSPSSVKLVVALVLAAGPGPAQWCCVVVVSAQLRVNEVAHSDGEACGGADWVELYNAGADPVDLAGYRLADDKGIGHPEALLFGAGSCEAPQIPGKSFLALCSKNADDCSSFAFRIRANDTVTLFDPNNSTVDSVALTGKNRQPYDVSFARLPEDGTGDFAYTGSPSFGTANLETAPAETQGGSLGDGSGMQGDDPETACERLKVWKGLDCAACVDPATLPAEDEVCPERAWADDYAEELNGLFDGGRPRKLFDETAFLWDEAAPLRTVTLHLDPEKWATLVADPAAEKYVEGKVTVSGDGPDGNPIPTLGEVGIRFKGFYGSLRMCLPGGGRPFACKKLSYKLNFKIANKTQTFFGLKRLQLHSGLHDISLMQEMLTYSLFREMGVATVRMTHCVLQLQVGDEVARAGVYMLTELLDGRFTDAYFRGGNGNLYKEAWPGFENAAEYDVRLRTNEDRLKTLGSEKTHAKFMEFSEKLALARDDFDLAVVVRTYTADLPSSAKPHVPRKQP